MPRTAAASPTFASSPRSLRISAIDERYVGRPYRHGWMLAFDTGKSYEGPPGPFVETINCLAHIDHATGVQKTWWPGPQCGIQEPCFIPLRPRRQRRGRRLYRRAGRQTMSRRIPTLASMRCASMKARSAARACRSACARASTATGPTRANWRAEANRPRSRDRGPPCALEPGRGSAHRAQVRSAFRCRVITAVPVAEPGDRAVALADDRVGLVLHAVPDNLVLVELLADVADQRLGDAGARPRPVTLAG